MKTKVLWLLLLLLQSPLPGSAGDHKNAAGHSADRFSTTSIQQRLQHPALLLDLQLKQVTALLTLAAQQGHVRVHNTPQWQYRLQQLEQQWQLLFQHNESRALNQIYNQFQIEIQLLQLAPAERKTTTLLTHIQMLEQLRLRLALLTGNGKAANS